MTLVDQENLENKSSCLTLLVESLKLSQSFVS